MTKCDFCTQSSPSCKCPYCLQGMSDEYIKKEDILKFIEDIKCNKDIPKNYGTLLDIMKYIRKMTVYDVDKMIQKMGIYKSQQSENEMLSDNGKWLVKRVIEECIKIVKSCGATNE